MISEESLKERLQKIEADIANASASIEQQTKNLFALEGARLLCVEFLNSKGMPLEQLKDILGADSIEVVDAGDKSTS